MISGDQVDVVVPILNEASCVEELVQRLRNACPGARLIFVDNGSTDGTLDCLRASGVDTVRHGKNEGYGRSLRDGIEAGTRPVILTIDADLEYPPECMATLLGALEESAVVYGSRFLGRKPVMSVVRRWGNQWLTGLFNLACGQRLTDLYTGVKAFRRDPLARHPFEEGGFAFVVEFAVRAARVCRIAEVAVEYYPRAKGRSKMRHFAEGLRAVKALVKYRLRSAG